MQELLDQEGILKIILVQICLVEVSAMMEMFHICAVQYRSH